MHDEQATTALCSLEQSAKDFIATLHGPCVQTLVHSGCYNAYVHTCMCLDIGPANEKGVRRIGVADEINCLHNAMVPTTDDHVFASRGGIRGSLTLPPVPLWTPGLL
jgi:hypothetical protein